MRADSTTSDPSVSPRRCARARASGVSSVPERVTPSVGASTTASTTTVTTCAAPSRAAAVPSRDHGVTVSAKSASLSTGRPERLRLPSSTCETVVELPLIESAPAEVCSATPEGMPEITTQAVSPGAPGATDIGRARPPSKIVEPSGRSMPRSSRSVTDVKPRDRVGTSDTGTTSTVKLLGALDAVEPPSSSVAMAVTPRTISALELAGGVMLRPAMSAVPIV